MKAILSYVPTRLAYPFLCSLFVLIFDCSYAQTYSKGDITLVFDTTNVHDTTICATICDFYYDVTIQNSFIGDSVMVINMLSGDIVSSAKNLTGQNPWIIQLPLFGTAYFNDEQVVAGFAELPFPNTKVISGADTIYNIVNVYSVPVPNICDYDYVTGKIYIDFNNDCIYNGTDMPLGSNSPMLNIVLDSIAMQYYSSTQAIDVDGNYTLHVQKSWMKSYSVMLPALYQFIFPPSTCSPIVYNKTTLPQTNLDFALQCSAAVDLSCYAFTTGVIRPNVPFILSPNVCNIGCNPISGTLKLVLDNRVTYNPSLSSNPASTVLGDTLYWNYFGLTNLWNNGYWNSFLSGIHLTPINTVNIGDTLCFTVLTDVPANDVNAVNNTYSFCLPVVNSFDPNLKEVSPKGKGISGDILPTTNSLTYTIHFQNTGNAVAYEVSVVDTLDPNIDPSSLKILGATHEMTPVWLSPNVVKFNFFNILLPDSSSNEPKSHGAVSFKINIKPQLPLGSVINNKAFIHFDSNPAIVTNSTINTISDNTGLAGNDGNRLGVSVSPNPFRAATTFSLSANDLPQGYVLTITDLTGNVVKSISGIKGKTFELNGSDLLQGIYLYRIAAGRTILSTGKLMVE